MSIIVELALIALLIVGLLLLLIRSVDLVADSFRRLKRALSNRSSSALPLSRTAFAPGSGVPARSLFNKSIRALRKKQKRFEKALKSLDNPLVSAHEVAAGVNELVDTMNQRIERAARITAHLDLTDEAESTLKSDIVQLHREITGTSDDMARDAEVAAANHKATQLRTLAEIKTVSTRLRADLIRLDAFIDDIQTRLLGMDLLGRKDLEFSEIKDLFERINNDITAAENIEEEFYRDMHAGPAREEVQEPLYLQYRAYWEATDGVKTR